VVEGRSRTQVNRQSVPARRLAGAVPVTVFSPSDLAMVQAGPSGRRELLDEALKQHDFRIAEAADTVERVLRQRAALLRQASGRLTSEVAATLDVWDDRLARAGGLLVEARRLLVENLSPLVSAAYHALAASHVRELVELRYRASWQGDLREALLSARADDLRRGATTVGPHRDELVILLDGRDTRTQASQGEQRCVALALRLGVHRLTTDGSGAPPILLLDDVFSELDPTRATALVHQLPAGQSLLSTAVPLPAEIQVARVVDVRELGVGAR
jgi:DNA replication and repair protein RecF